MAIDGKRSGAAGLVLALAVACNGASTSTGGAGAPGTPGRLEGVTASSVPPGDPHCAAGGVQLAFDGGVAYACNGALGPSASSAAGAQGATGSQGTPGAQGAAGAAVTQAVPGPGALAWKDATGRTVPGVHDLKEGRFYVDERGVLWQLDARRARISADAYSPFVMAARAAEYPSDDCSGDPFVALDDMEPRVAYETTSEGDGSPYAVLPDDLRALPSFGDVTIRSAQGTSCDADGCSPVCDSAATMPTRFPYAVRGAGASDLRALPTFTKPAFDFVAPLHPEWESGASSIAPSPGSAGLAARHTAS